MDYPIWDLAMGGGMLMALVAVPHVIVAHFAVGGGLLIAVTETLGVRRNDPELRELAKRSAGFLTKRLKGPTQPETWRQLVVEKGGQKAALYCPDLSP